MALGIIILLQFTPLSLRSIGWSGIGSHEATAAAVDSAQPLVYITAVGIAGNKVTRARIILREMMLQPGDSLSPSALREALDRSRKNLMNTSLFNFADIALEEELPGRVRVKVTVVERWYIWPIPIVRLGDRNLNVWWETKDFSRLSYGFYVDWKNFRGRREKLVTRFQAGYDQIYDFHYQVPYLNRAQTLGIGVGAGFHASHETVYMTRDNKQMFYQPENGYARKDIFAFANLFVRKNIYNSHLFELKYDRHHFHDSLVILNPAFSLDGAAKPEYFTLHYKYKSDHRDYVTYPLEGYYFDVDAHKYGLGFEGRGSPDFFSLMATFRKYWKFTPWLYYAAGLNCKFSSDDPEPYYLSRSIGYGRDIVRSYEYYVVDGSSFGILKTNLKFALVSQRRGEINFIRSEKFSKFFYAFYGNLFLDMGYADHPGAVKELGNTLQNEFLMGFGAGIDFVSYYDIVLRFEYSASKTLEHGFFMHLTASI